MLYKIKYLQLFGPWDNSFYCGGGSVKKLINSRICEQIFIACVLQAYPSVSPLPLSITASTKSLQATAAESYWSEEWLDFIKSSSQKENSKKGAVIMKHSVMKIRVHKHWHKSVDWIPARIGVCQDLMSYTTAKLDSEKKYFIKALRPC